MIKYMFIVLLIIHILGDFYFQTEYMAENKREKFKWVIIHLVVYSIVALSLFKGIMPGAPQKYVWYFIISHSVIDVMKFVGYSCKYINEKIFMNNDGKVFIIDQLLHISIIFVIVYYMRECSINDLYNIQIRKLFDVLDISEISLLSWIVKILLIHKPVNILIANILCQYKPEEKADEDKNTKKTGRFIGTLERIIMTIFISIEQYSAVGLVLTAKSIARYDKISKDQEFAEYYLLGTLLSTICAVCVSILF